YMGEHAQADIIAFNESMILEMGNILSSAYLTATEQFTGLFLLPSIPNVIDENIKVMDVLDLKAIPDPKNPLVVLRADMFLPPYEIGIKFYTILVFEEAKRVLTAWEDNLC
ncbi:hypothetical protein ACFL27_13135, partial [candidate division CSSED10-310 bacterium]